MRYGNIVGEADYWVYMNDPIHDPNGYDDTIKINKQGKMVDKRALVVLDIVVQVLRSNPHDMDPLSHTELLFENSH